MTLRIRIEFLSDWHVGSGLSSSDGTDRGVVRDQHGFPYVPAKTLTGVLRDSLETVTTALGSNWSAWTEVVFGSQPSMSKGAVTAPPRPAVVSIRPGFVSNVVKAVLEGDRRRHHLTHVKAGVSIDAKTGTARERHLNFIEVNRPVELWSVVEIETDRSHRSTVIALLQAACAFTENIGGRRRKGLGRCRVELFDGDAPVSSDFETSLPEQSPIPPSLEVMAITPSTWADDSSQLVEVDVLLTARTPVLVGASTIGNIVVGDESIAGATLLPHLHRWISSAGGDARALIGAGRARALRAVPEVDGTRGLPASFALQRPKDDSAGAWRNTAVTDEPGDVITKQLRSGWVGGEGREHSFVGSIMKVGVTHNAVDDATQRPTSDSQAGGGLFTYIAVQAGTTFHGRFLVPASLRPGVVAAIAEQGSIRVGRSKKDDYGWLEVQVADDFDPYPQSEVQGMVRVWAASHVIPTGDVSAQGWLDDLCVAAEVDTTSVSVDLERSRVRFTRIDSWHSSWGFPRPTLLAIEAGSCLVVRADSTVSATALRALSTRCVGQRTAEGLGEISVDHPMLAGADVSVKLSTSPTRETASAIGELSIVEKRFVTAVERSAVRSLVREAAISARAAGKSTETATKFEPLLKVNRSQLGRLRAWVQYLEQPLHGSAIEQLEHDIRAWKDDAKAVVRKMLTQKTWVWEVLDLSEAERTDHLGNDLSELLWGDAVRALVEVVHREATRGGN